MCYALKFGLIDCILFYVVYYNYIAKASAPICFPGLPLISTHPARWLSGERVGLMTRWFEVRYPVGANFLSGVFSPLTSAEACEKSSRWLWKERLCWHWCEKARKHICVTDSHDMTLAVKVALHPNTTNLTLSQTSPGFYLSAAQVF